MQKHEWRHTTEEGETRLVCVSRHGGKWQLRAKLKSEPDWTLYSNIPLDELETLRDILEKKYQRSRVPHEHIAEIDALINAAKPKN